MKLGYDLTIEQTQKLTMTPELIQAIQILQFNTQELESFVQEQIMQNPVLEYDGREIKKEPEISKQRTLTAGKQKNLKSTCVKKSRRLNTTI